MDIRPIPTDILHDPAVRADYADQIAQLIDWPFDPFDCWVWTGNRLHFGHGWVAHSTEGERTGYLVHRIMHAWWNGDTDQVLDHLCDVTYCVNPAHLRPTTPKGNNARSLRSPTAINARKTHCLHGHPFDGANLIVLPSGRRQCRACESRRQREWRARRAQGVTIRTSTHSRVTAMTEEYRP